MFSILSRPLRRRRHKDTCVVIALSSSFHFANVYFPTLRQKQTERGDKRKTIDRRRVAHTQRVSRQSPLSLITFLRVSSPPLIEIQGPGFRLVTVLHSEQTKKEKTFFSYYLNPFIDPRDSDFKRSFYTRVTKTTQELKEHTVCTRV